MTKAVKKSYDVGVFIFRRDLRLDDNLGLLDMLNSCETVLPLFCLDSNQIIETPRNKYYYSPHAVQFMCESLVSLNTQLVERDSRLRYVYGEPASGLADLLTHLTTKYERIAVGWNYDFSEYSQKRDDSLSKVCEKFSAEVMVNRDDYSLRPIKDYAKTDGGGFKKFSSFLATATSAKPNSPRLCDFGKLLISSSDFPTEFSKPLSQFYTENKSLAQRGGRAAVLKRLEEISRFKDYNEKRDMLSYNPTNLSAALNFGCVSIREALHSIRANLGSGTDLIKQLYWRDYHLSVGFYLPHGLSYTRMMDPRFDKIAWKENKEEWEKLIEAKTGFLLVDAAMEQMKATGYLHGRARMILGMFWTKYLMIHIYNPIYGLQVGFSRYLVDAVGPTQNKLNCAWIIELDFAGRRYAPPGAPCAGRPMSIGNKMMKKWDPEGKYVRHWLPQMKAVPIEALIDWDETVAKRYSVHPPPIFDEKERYDEWIEACRKV